MGTIVFTNPTAERVWTNVRGHLDLLDGVDRIQGLTGDALADAQAKVVSFICTAAYGYNPVHDARYGNWAGRFRHLLGLNPWAYRLHLTDEPLQVELDLGGRHEVLDFGRVDGCTGVIPLTEKGFLDYMANRVRLTGLAEGQVSPWTGDRHGERYLVITGAFHVPSIPGMDAPREKRRPLQPGALGGVCTLFGQVARFLPYLYLSETNRVTWAGNRTDDLPVVLCPMSGLGMGDQLIEKLGFVSMGREAGRWRSSPWTSRQPMTG